MRKLVATLSVFHWAASLNLQSLLIDHKTIVGDHSSDFIFFQLTTNHENPVLCLYTREVSRDYVMISDCDLCCVLRRQFVNKHHFELLIEVVKTGLLRLQNKIWLKAANIVQESTELVDLAADLNSWTRIFLHEFAVLLESLGKIGSFLIVVGEVSLLLQNVKVLGRFFAHVLVFLNEGLHLILHLSQ